MSGINAKKWLLARLFMIPTAISFFVCFIIIPLVSAFRNLFLYNYFPWDTFWADAPYLLIFGFLPLFLVLMLFTALGLWGYLKYKKRGK
jgi:hypothetical protein